MALMWGMQESQVGNQGLRKGGSMVLIITCWSGILDRKRHKPHSDQQGQKERHWLIHLNVQLPVFTSVLVVSANVLTLRLTEMTQSTCWPLNCDWSTRTGSCAHPGFQFEAAVTCESSECPHLDPVIQASCFRQRISPAHMDQGPAGAQDAVEPVARSAHPLATTPKGPRGRRGRQSRLLSLGGTHVWPQCDRCHGHQKSPPGSKENSLSADWCLKFCPVLLLL